MAFERTYLSRTICADLDQYYFNAYTNAIYKGVAMAIASVFINNRSQAVRLPAELRLPDSVKKVNVRAVGNDRIISPVDQTWDSFFNSPGVTEDFLIARAAQNQADRETL